MMSKFIIFHCFKFAHLTARSVPCAKFESVPSATRRSSCSFDSWSPSKPSFAIPKYISDASFTN